MAEDIRTALQGWDRGAWCLAAVAVALDPARADGLDEPAARLLAALALPSSTSEVERSGDVSPALLAAQAAAPLLQVHSVLHEGASTWDAMPDDALVAQGGGSAQMVAAFRSAVLPHVPALAEALEHGSPRMLDVGTGVGLMALEFAAAFPALRVTGIDVMPRALALAERHRSQHPAGDRLELVEQDVARLDREATFDLAWLPAPFIPRAVLEPGLRACARSLKPGGWLMMAHGKLGADPVEAALTEFKTACFGGSVVTDDEAATLLRAAGLGDLQRVTTPPGAPAIVLGRASSSRP